MSTILFLLLGTARLARSFPLGEVLSFLKGVSLARFKPCLTHEVTPFFPFCLSLLQLFHTHAVMARIEQGKNMGDHFTADRVRQAQTSFRTLSAYSPASLARKRARFIYLSI